jgi:acyl-CoA synthetase (AMP-forming)/AMP-acid ligase II
MAGPAAGAAWARSDDPVFPEHEATTVGLLRHAAEHSPDNLAVATPDERLTYRDLDWRSTHLAGRLVEAGVGKGTHVGILLPNNAAWVVAWAAVTRIGAVATPVNTFYKTPELATMLRHADVQVLIATTRFAKHDYVERLTQIAGFDQADAEDLDLDTLPQLRRIFWWEEDDSHPWATGGIGAGLDDDTMPFLPMARVAAMADDVVPADPMLITYTSGSTGDPKGVIHGHGPLVRHARNLAAMSGLGPDDRIWTPMPLCWVGGFSFTLLRALSVGAAFVTQELFEPTTTLRLLEAERVSFVSAWPNTSATLRDHPDYATTDLSHLRRGTFFEARAEDERPADPGLVVTSLGMSETAGPHTFWTEEEDVTGAPEEYRGTFGHQVPGVEHRIVGDDGTDAAEGEEGEVWVRGYSLMLGLYKVERADVFDADGWYHTGDRGYFRDGWFFFTGRQTDLIKAKGSNVAPAEVEKTLVALPSLKAAYVFGVDHPERGQDVVALVVPDPDVDATASPDELRAELRDRLSSYKVPRHVFTIDAADVPFLTSQKPDRRSLASKAADLTAAARADGADA